MNLSDTPLPISQILTGLLNQSQPSVDGKVPLDQMVEALGNRAFGILFLLFGLPNCFPMPPGLPILCGIVIAVVSVQMVLGKEYLVLPGWLGRRRVDRNFLGKVVDKSSRVLQFFERFSRPRYEFLSGDLMRRMIGLAGLALSIALMAPIPFVGGIPPGIAVTILGLALVQRDGVIIAFGVLVATPFALAVTYAMLYALFQGATKVF